MDAREKIIQFVERDGAAVRRISRWERIGAFVASLLFAFVLGGFSYQLYWAGQESFRLHEFSVRANASLAPVDCKRARGKEGADFISAYASSYRDKNTLKEACWYPVDRLLDLFPEERSQDVDAVILDHYKRVRFHVRAFKTKPPSRFILLGIPLAFCVALIGCVILLFGPRTPIVKAPEHDEKPEVDPDSLTAELARLRRDLER